MSQNQKDGSLKDLWIGMGITLGIYLFGFVILLLFPPLFFGYLILAAIALIVIPIVFFTKGKKRLGQGALIGLGLNILLFTACFGMIMYSLGW